MPRGGGESPSNPGTQPAAEHARNDPEEREDAVPRAVGVTPPNPPATESYPPSAEVQADPAPISDQGEEIRNPRSQMEEMRQTDRDATTITTAMRPADRDATTSTTATPLERATHHPTPTPTPEVEGRPRRETRKPLR